MRLKKYRNLPDTTLTRTEVLDERHCRRVAELFIQTEENRDLQLTVSIGVATFPGHACDWGVLVKTADMAMYTAKQAGRNQV
ncbi:MAG: diguanylate cyclase [Candidatus Thiodiazotropha sp. (ex Monitilora ramsayi)]|nr:diguanylate cyclase [Candidatus Thiodiazotropha sp. (ex Monitilora ramsayi)]